MIVADKLLKLMYQAEVLDVVVDQKYAYEPKNAAEALMHIPAGIAVNPVALLAYVVSPTAYTPPYW